MTAKARIGMQDRCDTGRISASLDERRRNGRAVAWRAGQGSFGRVSEWLFLDQFLRGKVLLRLQLSRGPWSQRVVLAPLSGQCHELELLVAGLLLGSDEVAP